MGSLHEEALSSSREPSMGQAIDGPHRKRILAEFDVSGGVFIVTGGAQGVGFAIAEGLAEAGGEVYCLDWAQEPDESFITARRKLRGEAGTGQLHYQHLDLTQTDHLERAIEVIAAKKKRLDGLCAAAAVQHISPAIELDVAEAQRLLNINFTGMLMTATACGRQMLKYHSKGAICLVASMSGIIANKGMLTPVYNASKAGVIQLARSLAMEWSKTQPDGSGGIRVNALSPGHVHTPALVESLKKQAPMKEHWDAENMMGRLADPSEFKGAGLFLLSPASSFMTGNNLIIDGGYTAW